MKLLVILTVLMLPSFAQTNPPVFNTDKTQLLLQDKVILDSQKDGYMHLSEIRFAPDGQRFLVLACGFECTDNVGFICNADGTGKRKFTARWDWILQDKVEWSADSRYVFYYRINSTGADPPPRAPREGWMQVAVRTGAKSSATVRRLKPNVSYAVFRVSASASLKVRSGPGLNTKVVGKLPFASKGIQFLGATKSVGKEVWARIQFGSLIGWVNHNYLYEEPQ